MGSVVLQNIPEFDEKNHAFTVDGLSVPGYTAIVNACGIGVNRFWTDRGRDIGTAIHRAIHYYAEGDLDYDSVDEIIKPRLDAYISFCEDKQFKPDICEQPLYHPQYRYCCISDQVQFDRLVVDFKAGPNQPEHALQTAAQAHVLPNPYIYDRWGVQLRVDGKYKIEPYRKQDLQNDFNIFLSCLNIFNFKLIHNIGGK